MHKRRRKTPDKWVEVDEPRGCPFRKFTYGSGGSTPSRYTCGLPSPLVVCEDMLNPPATCRLRGHTVGVRLREDYDA